MTILLELHSFRILRFKQATRYTYIYMEFYFTNHQTIEIEGYWPNEPPP